MAAKQEIKLARQMKSDMSGADGLPEPDWNEHLTEASEEPFRTTGI